MSSSPADTAEAGENHPIIQEQCWLTIRANQCRSTVTMAGRAISSDVKEADLNGDLAEF
ncbi:hypothetical protein QA646_28795 (plasmid) [Rhizobium sp. CB3090]|uniref:hypothetical protein n=1 Tax=Rhizobium sp. CB3090 TaxID=3039156 RepID=UPI0024B0CA80|nr:hypothetical protein [Rhizobium sp. CB3090]WFU12889.1 hypothetical protein QA646_28795 [Rhizobium sp. CB3090]